MDLSFSAEHEAFRETVVQFLKTHAQDAPRAGRGNPKAWQKLLIENGYAARTIPTTYGGYGAEPDILKSRIIAEEFARAQVSPGLGGQGISMLVPTLLEMGSEAQKQQFIAPTLRGDLIWCQGYSEPDAGSDLASLRTKAELDGDHWVVSGQKIWTSTAHLADWIFCLVRTEPDAPKHDGISFLLFSMKTPGIEIRPLVDMTGAANFNEVFFTDVRVPATQIVGRRGEGWKVANAILRHERGSLADPNTMLSRLNALSDLMKVETVDGRRAIDDPVFRDRLMRIHGRVLAMRCNDLRLLSAAVNKRPASLAAMVVKLQEYMYFLGLIIGGGTSQIQKNIIAERGLGLPREPKPASA